MKNIFPQIVGNNSLRYHLGLSLQKEIPDLPHAYILEGAEGTGKRTLALALAQALVCENRLSPSHSSLPCGVCRSCRMIREGICPDIIEISRGSSASVGVDAVRELRRDIHIYPNDLEKKIYIINDAHTMTTQAQNALLLTLEEPPAYAFILLLCENASAMLETIRSRAPVIGMQPLTPEETETALLAVSKEAEQLRRQSPELFSDIIMSAEGSVGTALRMMSGKEGERISLLRRDALTFCTLAADSTSGAKLLLHLGSCVPADREEGAVLFDTMLLCMRDLALLKKDANAPLRFFSSRERALELCDRFSLRRILAICDALSEAGASLRRNLNRRLTIINLLSDIGMLK